jgi:hypothetical protein
LACALVSRVNGILTQVSGVLVNIAGVETKGIDFNVAYRGIDTGVGKFGLTWNNTFLTNYDVIVPITAGRRRSAVKVRSRAARRRASRNGSRLASSIGMAQASVRR